MQNVVIPRIKADELSRFRIVLNHADGEELYMEKLNPFVGKEQLKILGYEKKRGDAHIPPEIKAGNYVASRFRLLCVKCKIKPKEIKTIYDRSKVLLNNTRYGLIEVDSSVKKAIWLAVCDGL